MRYLLPAMLNTTEFESDHEAIIPSCSLESDALAVEDFGLQNSLPDIIRRCPMRGLFQLILTFERDFRFRGPAPLAGAILSVSRDLDSLHGKSGGLSRFYAFCLLGLQIPPSLLEVVVALEV